MQISKAQLPKNEKNKQKDNLFISRNNENIYRKKSLKE